MAGGELSSSKCYLLHLPAGTDGIQGFDSCTDNISQKYELMYFAISCFHRPNVMCFDKRTDKRVELQLYFARIVKSIPKLLGFCMPRVLLCYTLPSYCICAQY